MQRSKRKEERREAEREGGTAGSKEEGNAGWGRGDARKEGVGVGEGG